MSKDLWLYIAASIEGAVIMQRKVWEQDGSRGRM